MTQMIRKQIYIQPAQDATLKQRAMMLGVTEAELIRRAIDRHMAVLGPGVRDMSAWDREKAFIAKRMAVTPRPGPRRFKREDAYEERLKRYGR